MGWVRVALLDRLGVKIKVLSDPTTTSLDASIDEQAISSSIPSKLSQSELQRTPKVEVEVTNRQLLLLTCSDS
jgi:hypothetical protein